MKDKPFHCTEPGCRYKSFETEKQLHMHLGKLHKIFHPTVKVAPRRFCKACGIEVGPRKHYCDACRKKAYKASKDRENAKRREKRRDQIAP